jgi:D-apionolactonase
MVTLSRFQLWHGRNAPPVERRELRAGPLTALLEEGDLRYIRVGGVEIVRRIYVAVRDEVWNTIPAQYSDFEYAIAPDHFTVRLRAHHQYQRINVDWVGVITGLPDGTIRYAMDAVANGAFRYCKIGFNIHHPPDEAGRPYRARGPEGTSSGRLPELVEPQRNQNGRLTALFPPYDSLEIDHDDGFTVRFAFEGDLFEMQDHRNWTDGNYKSYGTPLSIPWPMDATSGERFHQVVSVSVAGAPARTATGAHEARVDLGRSTDQPLPHIGFGMASHGASLSAREADLLRRVHPDHLRVDLYLGESWKEELKRGIDAARTLGAQLELALFLTDEAEPQLAALAAELASARPPVVRALVFYGGKAFSTGLGSTPGKFVRLARERLKGAVGKAPFVGGTNQFFAELNRDRPEVEAMEGVVFSINPQVHAADDESLVENLAAQAATVVTARSYSGDLPIMVSPITLAARSGPYPAGPPAPGGLPPQVDVRQASLFGAGWTAVSVKYLAASRVASITYYETSGWRGLVEVDAGSPMPEKFPSSPGTVFPMYHVFRDLADWKVARLVESTATEPLLVDGLAVKSNGTTHVLVANLTPRPQAATVGPFQARSVRVRQLNEDVAPEAMSDPERFRASGTLMPLGDGRLSLELPPYAIARLDEA